MVPLVKRVPTSILILDIGTEEMNFRPQLSWNDKGAALHYLTSTSSLVGQGKEYVRLCVALKMVELDSFLFKIDLQVQARSLEFTVMSKSDDYKFMEFRLELEKAS